MDSLSSPELDQPTPSLIQPNGVSPPALPPQIDIVASNSRARPIMYAIIVVAILLLLFGSVVFFLARKSKPTSIAPSTLTPSESAQLTSPLPTLTNAKNLTINGDLNVSGGTTLQNVTIQGSSALKGALDVAGSTTIAGNLVVAGTITAANFSGAGVTTTGSGATGARGPAGPTGAPGPRGAPGANGSSTPTCTHGGCVSLQPTSPGVQEAGHINISGNITAANLIPAVAPSVNSGVSINDAATINTPGGFYNDSRHWSAVGIDGFTKFVYFDNNYTDLIYTACTNSDCTTSTSTTIATAVEVDFPNIAIAPTGQVWISYINYNSPNELHIIKCANSDCSSKTDTLVDTGSYYESSLALNAAGCPSISYIDYTSVPYKAKLARFSGVTCSTLNLYNLNTGTDSPDDIAMAITTDDKPRILYKSFKNNNFNVYTISLLACTDSTCTGTTNTSLSSVKADAYYLNIALDSTNLPSMTWGSFGSGSLYFAHCTTQDCSSGLQVSQLTANGGAQSLQLGRNGLAQIAYYNSNRSGVGLIQCSDANCANRTDTVISSAGGYPVSIDQQPGDVADIMFFDKSAGKLRLARILVANPNSGAGVNIGSAGLAYNQINAQSVHLTGGVSNALTVATDTGADFFTVDPNTRSVRISQQGSLQIQDTAGSIVTSLSPNGDARFGSVSPGTSQLDINVSTFNSNIVLTSQTGAYMGLFVRGAPYVNYSLFSACRGFGYGGCISTGDYYANPGATIGVANSGGSAGGYSVAGAAIQVPFAAMGFSGQTADLLQLQTSTGTVLSKFDASGNLSVGTSTSVTNGVATFNGNVGIGTTSPNNALGVVGNIAASGTINGGVGSPDYAENITTSDPSIEAADVVILDPARPDHIIKSSQPYQSSLLGIISTNPGFVTNAQASTVNSKITADPLQHPLALSGRVPVKVTDENGPIVPGDYLTSSSKPGYAMKAIRAGATIGKALGSFSGVSGAVLAFVSIGYVDPIDHSLQGSAQTDFTSINVAGVGKFGSLAVAGVATTQDLVVKGSASINELTVKDITVTGSLSVQGGITTAVAHKSTAYTITAADSIITADATSAAFKATLPTALGIAGRQYTIKKIDSSANSVTVATTNAQTIDGSTAYDLAKQYKYVTVVSDGSNWIIVGSN